MSGAANAAHGSSTREAPPRAPRYLGWVFLGGAAGTGLRAAAEVWLLPWAGELWAVIAVNLLGSALLGAVLEATRREYTGGPHSARLRSFLGTGLLGGFTTYSALAVALAASVLDGDGSLALIAGAVVLFGGLAMSAVGVALVAAVGRSRRSGEGS